MEFRDRLKKLRKEKGLTQKQLGEVLHICTPTVTLYERGKRQPDIGMLKRIASLFNVSVDYLIGYDKNLSYLHGNENKNFKTRFESKDVTLEHVIPDDAESLAPYILSPYEYEELKKYFLQYECVKDVAVNCGEHMDMTADAAWVKFSYDTPDGEIASICSSAIDYIKKGC